MKKNYLLLLFCLVFSLSQAQYLNNSIKKVNLSTIQEALNKQASKGYLSSDLDSWMVQSDASSKVPGMWHYYLVQTHNGIVVRNSIANVSVKDGVATVNNSTFIKGLESKIKTITPSISAIEAVKKAFGYHKLNPNAAIQQLAFSKNKNEYTYSKTKEIQSDIKVKLVYDVVSDNEIKLTWNVNLDLASGKHWWNTRIDAQTGAFVSQDDWVVSCNWGTGENHSAHNHSKNVEITEADVNFSEVLFRNTGENAMMANSYRALPYYVESPIHGDFELIVSPQDGTASPNGWHNDGSSYTTTRGNNVIARDDQNSNNGSGPLTSESSSGLIFDYPYGGPYVAASTYIDAAQTNVFYMSNAVHDIYYQYGFDEASGNFQVDNYGKGGTAGDPLDADVQDGAGVDPNINNANFSTPVDGSNPRMQMYLWNKGVYSGPLLTINNTGLAGDYEALDNAFTAGHVDVTSPITQDLVLVIDDNTGGTSSTDANDGCGAITNGAALNGKIAVVRRGACNFTAKAIEAQNAGAVAVLIVNNVDGDISMAGGDAAVTIPAYSINKADGDAIIALMGSETINATFNAKPAGYVNTDGDFDNGVIAHEYGHGINIRLVGGRNNSSCVNANESMGEGWADYIGKILMLKNIDNGIKLSGMGTFVAGQSINGQGIRPAPYSGDISNNPMTYETLRADTGNATYPIPHGVGAVWAGMLWDLTWDLIAVHGFTDNIYDANSGKGNTIALNLIVEGFKLTSCDPGFEDGRDAILQADQNLYGGANKCIIWSAFARRGLGHSSDQGNTNSTSDGAHAYDLPPSLGCTPNYIVTNGDSGNKAICSGTTSVEYEFVFNEQNGFDTATGFAATGLPAGASAVFSPTTMKDTGLFTMTVSNIPVTATNYTITVTPGGDAGKAVTAELVVNQTNPDITDGDTEYDLDSSGSYTSFSNGSTITIGENKDLDLRLPAASFNGTAVWTGPNAATYNGASVAFASVPDNDPAVEGAWSLTVTSTNGCPEPQTMTFNINIDPLLSVNDNSLETFAVYPNPTSGEVTIIGASGLMNSTVILHDVTGRRLMNRVEINKVNDKTMTINMSNLSSGAYFISIETSSNKIVKRIIKN